MSLSVGIIGLPNVGKSTLFNVLTSAGAEASNYPFCTIDPNVGVAVVPDEKLEKLNRILEPQECVPASIRIVDVAGLVEGAHRGEGLGNTFLSHIREVDALVHVIRCFDDENVAHTYGDVDPVRDAEVIELELVMADLESAARALEGIAKKAKTEPKAFARIVSVLERVRESLEGGKTIRAAALGPKDLALLRPYSFLTLKPVIYCANVSEDDLASGGGEFFERLAGSMGGDTVFPVSARIEAELQELPAEERDEFRSSLGLTGDGLDRLVKTSYTALGLITFYTTANEKLRAWSIPAGTAAPQAAGRIHGDMEEGFIKAEVVSYVDLVTEGSMAGLVASGKVRIEGRDYEIRNEDVVRFHFRAT